MSDWNEMVFGFFKFIGIAFLVLMGFSLILGLGSILIDELKEKKKKKRIEECNKKIIKETERLTKELYEKEASLRKKLLEYDTTKIVIEIAYTALLKALAEKTNNLSATPHYIEKLKLVFRVSTDRGTVYLYSDSICIEKIGFYEDLRKENMLQNNFENSTFSAVVAYMLICRLELEEFNGLHYATVPTQEQVSLKNEHDIRDASIIIEIKNPNYASPQSWKRTTPAASQKSPVPPAKPAQSTVPAKTDTKPQPKTQPKKAQPKPTFDSLNDFDFTDDFDEWLLDEWLKKRSE